MAKRNDVPVKVDSEVIRVAKIAAAYKGLSLAEYLSETLRPIVARDVEQEHAKVAAPKKGKKTE
jgi:predicted DNA binding CopG/RHH family protein